MDVRSGQSVGNGYDTEKGWEHREQQREQEEQRGRSDEANWRGRMHWPAGRRTISLREEWMMRGDKEMIQEWTDGVTGALAGKRRPHCVPQD